ncbi:MAG: bifunctional [glutamate--ammonia ligase]-adenylyl-L-tyrosine phosphorylase/[glutamate--ammonia-ligase] adenylyltransferase [Gammaproteobacteria bacterium]|nr:MAG: bifunctional [glutamate--ammonia ligase]-adenylyl-L-tyrosine phosphorylase/[glutamate--ammonia-ligase] adenylyltransferase [Gammaproteobacteria bacterium]
MKFSNWPEPVAAHLEKQWQRLADAFAASPELEEAFNQFSSSYQQQLIKVMVASDYVVDQWARFPQLLVQQHETQALTTAYQPGEMRKLLQAELAEVTEASGLDKKLREFRRAQMIRLIWRDICRLADFAEVTQDLSDLADACVAEATNRHYEWMHPVWGTPFYQDTEQPMPMVILGMGKLGACELNLSSDIDLIFAFPHEGETQGGSRSIAHRDFFMRLGQRIIKTLDEVNADGFVFRTDMRLRPYGSAGALALSFNAMETYYEEQGREWERYAMIKARPMGDDNGEGENLLQMLRPFVYRRYIDFGVIESLREMKALINREVLRKGAIDNVKTGSGGIREVEFIVQAFQLIRGGQDKDLQERSLLKVLVTLENMQLLPAQATRELREAYIFLRDVEHRIQAQADRQTQNIPDDELGQLRIALSMDYPTWDEFKQCLDEKRHIVRHHFESVIASDQEEEQAALDISDAQSLWLDNLEEDERNELLLELGFAESQLKTVWAIIGDLRDNKVVVLLQPVPRQRLDKLMPLIISACGAQADSLMALERVTPLIEAILRRSAYMSLLVENTSALEHLATLCTASPWVAELMARYPVLLDELIDTNSLFSPPPVAELRNELRQLMLRIPEDDFEQQMDCLRQFKNVHLLRVAASEITGALPVMKVSDYLTWVAETILQQVLEITWKQMVDRHGYPLKDNGERCDPSFIIVGYGKMGGIELSYTSDLDLVFIHGAAANKSTDGDRSIDNNVFFTRLGQKIIHVLTSRMASGMLYETDMRLRPSGNSGLLVSSLKAFEQYQNEQAWTWEKQALVRTRVVAGCPELAAAFNQTRARILTQHRDPETLATEVVEMRHKMIDHLSESKKRWLDPADMTADKIFHLKQDPGGIVDIEFLVQYLVLRDAETKPALLEWPDNVRILEAIEKSGLLSKEDTATLTNAYLEYRSRTHRLALQNQKGKVAGTIFTEERQAVRQIWHKILPDVNKS